MPLERKENAWQEPDDELLYEANIEDMAYARAITYDDLVERVTLSYLMDVERDDVAHNMPMIKRELVGLTNKYIDYYNDGREDESATSKKKSDKYPDALPAGERFRRIKGLLPLQIALVLRELFHAVCVCWSDSSDDGNYDIGIYQDSGANAGTYDTSSDGVERAIRSLCKTATVRDIAETVSVMRVVCPHVERCRDRDLVAVNNGIYDYGHKLLMDFDPELVFTSKSHVDYVEGAPNPVIHNDADGTDWDVESWMSDLSDDPDVVDLLWEIVGAVIRPNVSWNQSAWFYSTLGNNGKGTLCTLMRNLCGTGSWASIPLKAFSEQFMLEPLTRVSAIITDENDTGTFVDDAAALKAVITHDPFQINRKFKDPRSLLFHGFMVQCVNEMPKLKDRSESMYRRLLVVPFEKRFQGRERKYIKDDYLGRKDVLEYVLWKVLATTDYYELEQPDACVELLEEYKSFNDPVRQFCEDTLPRLSWDLVPWDTLFKLYEAWYRQYVPSGQPQSKKNFLKDFRQILPEYPDWTVTTNQASTFGRMDYPEPLILEYDAKSLFDPAYRGTDPTRKCSPTPPYKARGILRSDNAPRVRRDVTGNFMDAEGNVEDDNDEKGDCDD